MCDFTYVPMFGDEFLRLILSILLFFCCVILAQIFMYKKNWGVAFWSCFAIFLVVLGGYGYVIHRLYLENTFSYDGFISGAGFLTVVGLLFSKSKGEEIIFNDKLINNDTPMFLTSFIVFSIIYVLTVDYNFECIYDASQLFIEALQIIVYPVLLLLGLTAFLFRFVVCIYVFAICMALFIIEDMVSVYYILSLITDESITVETMMLAIISTIISIMSICILIKAKRVYNRRRVND
ncbi:hypothetical protein [Allofrancisella frigidaquae]|uniref:Uncharacterized protein n=1 Tax=Allofrancisella frigidaquae TaxID=1085644 RepID=A0A6M3HUV7_9GAMM|nr:hypothetical protein [Allofrancisella frigidaquae]QIV95008.1 hypothetical protein E3E15_06490 [Allofrancisella frigidaquae]